MFVKFYKWGWNDLLMNNNIMFVKFYKWGWKDKGMNKNILIVTAFPSVGNQTLRHGDLSQVASRAVVERRWWIHPGRCGEGCDMWLLFSHEIWYIPP